MNYQVEDVSPTHKKVQITVSKEEVDAAIKAGYELYRKNINISGFRKGKIPDKVLKYRYGKDIFTRAKTDLINVHINTILQSIGEPNFSGIDVYADGDLVENTDYNYLIEFDTLPKFELPNYEGIEAEESEIPEMTTKELESLIARLRSQHARIFEVKDKKVKPEDTDIVNINLVLTHNGEKLAKGNTVDYELMLGKGQTLKGIEDLLKTLHIGETGESDVTFPSNFIDPKLSNALVHVRARLNKINRYEYPNNEELFKIYKVHTYEEFCSVVKEFRNKEMQKILKGDCQTTIINSLLKLVDFPIPERLLKCEMDYAVEIYKQQQDLKGQNSNFDEAALRSIQASFMPSVKNALRFRIFAIAIAKKEGLTVDDSEVQQAIYEESLKKGLIFENLRKFYENTGYYFLVSNRILADKAIELVYSRAKVKMIPAEEYRAKLLAQNKDGETQTESQPQAADQKEGQEGEQAKASSEAPQDSQNNADTVSQASEPQA